MKVLAKKILHKNQLVLLLLFLLQIFFVNAFLPLNNWFTPDAIYTDDFSIHYGSSLERSIFLKEFGEMWGYDPYTRAGTISSAFLTIDNNGWGIFSWLLFFLPIGTSFKLFFILSLLIVPSLCFRAARNFMLSTKAALIAASIGTVLLHVTAVVNFLQWGSLSFIIIAYISLFSVSYFYKFCVHQKPVCLILAFLSLTFSLWVHAFSVVILFIPFLVCYALFFKTLSIRHHCWILTALAVSFLLNLPWIIPFLTFKDQIIRENSFFFYTSRSFLEPIYTYFLRKNLFNSYMNMVFHKEEWVDILLLLFSLLGIWFWFKDKKKKLSAIFFASFIFLFCLSYYGSYFKPTQITPMRFILSLNTFLIIPAAVGSIYLYRLFLADKSLKVRVFTLGVLGYLTLSLVTPSYLHLFYKKDFRLTSSIPSGFTDLVTWIKENTTREGRILIENSGFGSGHRYYGTHLPYILPHLTDREYIGNHLYYNVSKDYMATFNEGYLFRKPVEQMSEEQMRQYFDQYNIRWVIYWSDASKKVFDTNPFFTPLAKINDLQISRVERDPTFFYKGSGTVHADYNRIQLTNVKADEGEIILCYHWMKLFKTDPPMPVEYIMLSDDMVGFIKIKNPPSELLIYNSYE